MVCFEVLLVDVVVRVDAVAVVVLVGVFDVVVSVLGVGMVVRDVAVVVLVAVAMLEVAGASLACVAESIWGALVVRCTGAAQADDREVAEACLIAERLVDRGAYGVEPGGVDAVDTVAAFADEVLALAVVLERVEARTVADVDVAHDAELFEVLEVAIDGAEV
jgi:hypothetical protein